MNKYNILIETALSRFNTGGFLTGDAVRVKKGAAKSQWALKQPDNLIEKLKEFVDTDKNIRISAVKASRPAMGDVQPYSAIDGYFCDVVIESAPGLYETFMTIPSDLLEHTDQDINLPDIPDSLRRDDKVTDKPELLKNEDRVDVNSPVVGETPLSSLPDSNYDKQINPNTSDNFNTQQYITGMK